MSSPKSFNPRTPYGVRQKSSAIGNLASIFQSTHPRGVRPKLLQSRNCRSINFNPRTREGCDASMSAVAKFNNISIHAPHAGCDPSDMIGVIMRRHFNPRTPCGVRRAWSRSWSRSISFQSTHPLRGATSIIIVIYPFQLISIHAPLAGCDMALIPITQLTQNFNPRTPCGVRRSKMHPIYWRAVFQSTHPLRGATPRSTLRSAG